MGGIRNAEAVVGEKKQLTLPKKGPRLGILTGIVDVGIQQQEYKGEKKRPCREFIPIYTLVNDTYENDEGDVKQCVVRPYPIKLQPGASKGKYYDWYNAHDPDHKVLDEKGRGDITKLIGTAVYVPIEYSKPDENGLIYANVSLPVTQIPEEVVVKPIAYEEVIFDLTEPSKEIFDKFGDWTKDKIRSSLDYAGSPQEAILEGNVQPQDGDEDANETGNADDDDSPI